MLKNKISSALSGFILYKFGPTTSYNTKYMFRLGFFYKEAKKSKNVC